MFLFSCAYAYAYVACVMLMSLVLCLSHKWEPGLSYEVTDLKWLRYHAHLAEFSKLRNHIMFDFCRVLVSVNFWLVGKTRTVARPNSPDMLQKRTKKVRLGFNIFLFTDSEHQLIRLNKVLFLSRTLRTVTPLRGRLRLNKIS